MTSEGDRREMKDVETDGEREGGMKKTQREGWGRGVLCFFSWNAAPRLSAAARKSRKTERLFLGRQTRHILAVWGQWRGWGAVREGRAVGGWKGDRGQG